ncbi:MAG: HPP family protein [Halomonas sp.]|uniref:HPP family protein n=1 Tax=unclassified Halomonas TaxID=2609666 RepID=UPI000D1C1D95|nr:MULTISPECIES: HPP family protein [unclassified Halomonas]MCC5900369.1 HPP family protein [Halomonas sp.]
MKIMQFLPTQQKAALLAGIGATSCITVLSLLSSHSHTLWLMAPFGATMVILFGLPASPLAQPRNIVAGHLITAALGLAVAHLLGVHEWTLGLAVGLSIAAMMLTNTTHPPAGANPLLIMLAGENWHFIITPVASGAIMIVGFGYVYHRFISGQQYPKQWF